MTWRPIPGWPYEASEAGEIRRTKPGANGLGGNVLRPIVHPNGYAQVRLNDGKRAATLWVHRLVCAAFHGTAPEGAEAAHYNGQRLDNRPANLRWATSAGNKADSIRLGTTLRGARHPGAKLSESQRAHARLLVREGMPQPQVAGLFGVTQPTVSRLCRSAA